LLRRLLTRLGFRRANHSLSNAASVLGLLATLALAAVPLALTASAGVAHAQDEHDTATARSLFEQGVELADKGDWAGAADRFERSDKLRHSPVVAYNLANAWVELGRLVEAAELLRQIEKDEAAKAGVKKDARSLLSQLEPRIATLVVEVESQPPPKDVRVNDRPLPQEAIGVPTPIDPGSVVVTVTDDKGNVLWSKRAEVIPGGQERITITLPKQSTEPAPAPVPTPQETARRAQEPQPAADPYDDGDFVDDDDKAFYEEPWVWVGAGAVVAAGIVVAILLAGGGDSDEPSGDVATPGTSRIGTITVESP
jgi:hypothetical protein